MCCSSLLKIMMFIFNGVIFLAGVAILGVGVWVKVDSNSFLGILDSVDDAPSELSQLVNITYVLIGVGAVLVLIGFLGCCGAVAESRCMLLMFFSIVLIIFLVEVAGAIVLFVFKDFADQLLEGVEEQIRKDIQNNYGDNDGLTGIWNTTMDQFKCCGFSNYTDFIDSPYVLQNGNPFPPPCCNATVVDVCNQNGARLSKIDGCMPKLLQLIKDNAVIVAAVAMGIAALEIAAMVVSMVLYCNISRK